MLYVMIRLFINQNGMKSQDNKINNVRFSSTQQNRTHHIYYNNEYSNHLN